jgi:intracellular sulfur oxidation DsrE/DsrF family protein
MGRRSFFSGGLTALAATLFGRSVTSHAQSAPSGRWQAERHEKDDWLDRVPGKHRLVLDTTTPDGFGTALLYTNNYFIANKDGYELQDSDLAVVIIARHHATPFAFNDTVWKKYGVTIAQLGNLTDPKTKQPPTINLYNAAGYGSALSNRGTTLDSLLKLGIRVAVCEMATRDIAESVARAVGTDGDSIFSEISRNLVSNSHLMPAGIVAVNRAQERGYAFVNT